MTALLRLPFTMTMESEPLLPGRDSDGAKFLHRSVSEALRQRLLDGWLAGGSKLPPLRALAGELAVSTMTVQRALQTLEREGHIYHIDGVGAFVRSSGPGLRRVAMVGSDLTSPFQMAVARGVQRAGRANGWSTQLLDAHWDLELEATHIRRLPELGVRGALLLPPFTDPGAAEALTALDKVGFPMVLLDMNTPGLQADLVTSNNELGAYSATRYLLDRGHRRIVFLSHAMIVSSVLARISGYERALFSAGIQAPPEWRVTIGLGVHSEGHREGRPWFGGCQAILPVLRQIERPVAVLAVDSYTGWGVYEACRELGLRIPDDVSVIAFDDVEITRALYPPMTVVAQRTDDMARTAIELLDARIQCEPAAVAGRKEIRQILIDVDLIERGSVARLVGMRP
jgi:LacI family transcriptional regulator